LNCCFFGATYPRVNIKIPVFYIIINGATYPLERPIHEYIRYQWNGRGFKLINFPCCNSLYGSGFCEETTVKFNKKSFSIYYSVSFSDSVINYKNCLDSHSDSLKLLYPRTKSGILWVWSRTPPPPEGNCLVSGGYRPQFWKDCFHIWYTPLGVKVSPPIENGQGRVISPALGGQKPPKLSTYSYFHCVA
jgi:hypothetical protein